MMAEAIIQKAGGGAASDECTAGKVQVLAGYTAVTKDSGDEPTEGEMANRGAVSQELPAGGSYTVPAGYHNGAGKVTAKSLASQTACSASDGYVYSGKTYWKDGVLRTGNMSVSSVLSFNAAAYGGKQILLKWQNPYAATGKPFSGVIITYSTSGYPGSGGTVIYQGAGNNTASGGWSQVIATMPAYGTTYYFSARPYVTCSAGNMYGNALNGSAATVKELWLTYTSSASYTIPQGYTKLDLFAVGGGGGSYNSSKNSSACGAGGGYTKTVNGIAVSGGQTLEITVGAGGSGNHNGSASSVVRSGTSLIAANGGEVGLIFSSASSTDGRGGSGGGTEGGESGVTMYGGQGGSDGSHGYRGNGSSSTSALNGPYGQGTTTRAWGLSSGTLYAGGGGGGSYRGGYHGAGGAGGGGRGGSGNTSSGYMAVSGSVNTGGGSGGCQYHYASSGSYSSSGGSGIVLIHVY